ncbi:MAG: hypothetical protein ACRELS_03640 [Candidatus Rokuibacteriota bacterium]
MERPANVRAYGPIACYYLATPIFFLLDALWGVNIRATALDDTPMLKYLYYALCLACGATATVRPSLSAVVGMAESSVNIVLIVLSVMLPYFRVLRSVAEGTDVLTNPFTPFLFVNFALSGVVGLMAFYRHQRALQGWHRGPRT